MGHQDPLGCIHHGPDGLSLGKRLLASLDQIIGAQSFFVGLCFRIRRRLGTGIFAALLECGCAIAGCCRGCSLGRAGRGWNRSVTRRGYSLALPLLRSGGGSGLLRAFDLLDLLALTRLLGLTLTAALGQFFFLAPDQLRLPAGFLYATRQLRLVDQGRRVAMLDVVRACLIDKDVFASELVIRAERSGVRIKEIPIRILEKRPPSINLLKRVPNVMKNVVKLFVAIRVRG